MEGHEERAAELEYELADMEKQQDKLDDEHPRRRRTTGTPRSATPSVPGAGTNEDVEGDTEATGGGAPEVEDENA